MTDVVIIGGGVIGCAIALELARRGVAATVVDRHGDVGHGSTSASCGIVRRFYSTPTMTAMAHEGAHLWANWGDYLRAPDARELAHFERPGMLFIPPAIDDGVRSIVAHMRALGVAVEILSPAELQQRFPFLDTASNRPIRAPDDPDFSTPTGRSIDGGVFEADAGYVVSPQLATRNLRAAGEREGVEFRLGCPIAAITRRGSRFTVTLADHTTLQATAVVNAAGPHSAIINRLAGVTLPIETRPLRREVHAVANPTWTATTGSPLPVVGDVDSGVYFRPESGARDIIVGSLDPQCDRLEWVDDPDDCNTTCTNDGYERQVMRTMKRFPDIRLGPRRGIADMYDVCTLDWHPILDRTDLPGYYVAIGTSGSSFKTAPVIGGLMAELIVAGAAGRDHDLEPVRVPLAHVDFEVDLGFFSRHRGAQRSSGTVLG